jgi:hypothetical protein
MSEVHQPFPDDQTGSDYAPGFVSKS